MVVIQVEGEPQATSDMSKPRSYVVKTTITKGKGPYGINDQYVVIVEGSGFEGNGKGYSLSTAFEQAYDDLMSKVSEAIFQEEV